MSRVGKQPITLPSDVKAHVQGSVVSVEGKGTKLAFQLGRGVAAEVTGGEIIVKPIESISDSQVRANYGTARARINNMVVGVTKGWKRNLELNGVGFNAQLQGDVLKLSVGFSHDVLMPLPKGIKCVVTKTTIELESADREAVGTFAANIRKVQPPEPYLGKGIKYAEETVRRKAGKTGKK